MQRHDVARGAQRIDVGYARHTVLRPHRIVGLQDRIVGDDFHVERFGAARHRARNAAEADEAQALAHRFAEHQIVARPFAGEYGVVGFPYVAQAHEDCGDHVFGDRYGVGPGRRKNLDAAPRTLVHVDIVETYAQAADDL